MYLYDLSAEYLELCISINAYDSLCIFFQEDTMKGVVNGIGPSSPGSEKNDKISKDAATGAR